MKSKESIGRELCVMSKILLTLVGLIPTVTLIGWLFEIELFKRLVDNSVAMNPLTAVLLMVAFISFGLIQHEGYSITTRNISTSLAVILILIGLYKILSLIFGFPFILDQIFFSKDLVEPGRFQRNELDPVMAFVIFNVGIAIILLDKHIIISENLLFFNTLISLLCLYGYAYGVKFLIGIGNLFPMSILGAFCILFFNLSALFARPRRGNMAILIGESPFEVVNMRLIAFFMPLFVGWSKLYGEDQEWFTKEFGTAIFAVFSYGVSMYFLKRQSTIQYKLRELKKEEERMTKEDAQKLNAILDNIPAIIYIQDMDRRFETINRSFEKFHDLTKDQVAGKKAKDIFEEKYVKLFEEREDVLVTGQSQNKEFTLSFKDRKRCFWNVSFPLRDMSGKIYAVCSVSVEITMLKENEKEIREKKAWLDYILDNLTEGVLVANQDRDYILYNKVAKNILQTEIAEITDDDEKSHYYLYDLEGEKKVPSDELPMVRALNGEKVYDYELLVKDPRWDEPKHLSVSAMPIVISDAPSQAVAVFRDVTEKRKTQKEIKENARKLRTILMSIEEGILVVDEKGKPFIVNKKAIEILGDIERDLEWEAIPERYHLYRADNNKLYEYTDLPIYKALREDKGDEAIIIVRNPNHDQHKTIKVAATPVTFEDGAINVVVVITDITMIDYPAIE